MMRRRRGLLGLLLTLGLGLTAGLAGVPAAQAVTGSPPVTTPDTAPAVYAGNVAIVTPLANDTDPDGDALAICRLGTEKYNGVQAELFGPDLGVLALPRAKPGTYTFTYYACDFSYLTPGTFTVTVLEAPDVKVQRISGRPGKLRVTNPADFAIRVVYGSFREAQPDGTVSVKKGGSAVITVHRPVINWIAFNRRGDVLVGHGTIRAISLPPGDHPPVVSEPDQLPDEVSRAWHAW